MKNLLLLVLMIIVMSACNSGVKKQQVVAESNSEFKNLREYEKKTTSSMRAPSDVAIFFQLTEAVFMPKLINNPLIYEKYTSIKEITAANIGVYWVDALYQYSYKEKEGAKASALAAIELAKTLEIGDVFKEILIEKYTENTQTDSFFIKLDESFMNAEYILSERARMRIYISMLMGKYIQTQYILFSLIFDYPSNVSDEVKLTLLRELLFVMNQNIESTNALVKLIDKYEKPEDKGILVDEIKAFSKNYQSINFEDQILNITPEMVFENDTLKLMYDQIKDMHDYVIGLEN